MRILLTVYLIVSVLLGIFSLAVAVWGLVLERRERLKREAEARAAAREAEYLAEQQRCAHIAAVRPLYVPPRKQEEPRELSLGAQPLGFLPLAIAPAMVMSDRRSRKRRK